MCLIGKYFRPHKKKQTVFLLGQYQILNLVFICMWRHHCQITRGSYLPLLIFPYKGVSPLNLLYVENYEFVFFIYPHIYYHYKIVNVYKYVLQILIFSMKFYLSNPKNNFISSQCLLDNSTDKNIENIDYLSSYLS